MKNDHFNVIFDFKSHFLTENTKIFIKKEEF